MLGVCKDRVNISTVLFPTHRPEPVDTPHEFIFVPDLAEAFITLSEKFEKEEA
jgi:hypothetical protein